MKLRYFAGLPLLALAMWGCYEDKGHYDYIASNEVTIEFGELGPQIVGERLLFTPTVTTQNVAAEGDFEYWWANTGVSTSPLALFGDATKFDTICRTKQLDYVPNTLGNNILRFYVREKATGVITEKQIAINVSTKYQRGWMVLSNKDGKSSLSFVNPGSELVNNVKTRKFTPYPDIYNTLFPNDPLGEGPALLRAQYGLDGSLVYVFQDDEPVVLSGNTFGKQRPFSGMFQTGAAPAGFHPKDLASLNANPDFSVLLSTDGKVYVRWAENANAAIYTNLYPAVAASFENEELHIDRMPETNISAVAIQMLVDQSAKRVLGLVKATTPRGMGRTGSIAKFTHADTDTPEFDYDGWGDAEPIHLYGGNTQSRFTAVYRKDGKFRYQIATGQMFVADVTKYPLKNFVNGDFPAEVEVSANSVFHNLFSGNVIEPYMFIGEKNKLYWFDINSRQFNLFYEFAAGEVIVDMQENPQQTELVVVTRDGTFTVLDLTRANIMVGKKIYETKLPGNVVDLEYKFQNFNGVQFRSTDF
jgi:hypothetical protein